jgi:hypothetical protein
VRLYDEKNKGSLVLVPGWRYLFTGVWKLSVLEGERVCVCGGRWSGD